MEEDSKGLETNISQLIKVFKANWPTERWKEYGFYNDDYLLLINRHWLKFPPPSEKSHYVLALIYSVIMTVGVSGNILVIFMFLRCRSLRTPANILVMNLAVSDCILMLKMPIFIFNSYHFGPALGAIACSAYGFIGGLTGTVSIMTLAAIAMDRYQVIAYPLARKSRQRTHVGVLFIWIYGTVFAGIPLFGINKYVPEGYLTSCSFDYLSKEERSRIMIMVFFGAAWVVPFLIITICYARICRVVIKTRKEQYENSLDSSRHYKESVKRKAELKLAGVVIGVIGLWFVSWTPYAIVALLGVSGYEEHITPLSSMIPALICKIASAIDPYIYAVMHPRFKLELKSLIQSASRRRLEQKQLKYSQKCWVVSEEKTVVPRRSSEDVEEMMVMVDLTKVRQLDSSVTIPGDGVPIDDMKKADYVPPPSWFVHPYYTRSGTRRSTSFKSRQRLDPSLHGEHISL